MYPYPDRRRLAAVLLPMPAAADDITDALNAAIEAYEAGDMQDALAETAYATQLLNEVQSEGLAGFLPACASRLDAGGVGRARHGLGFMGGGSAAEAEYTGPGGSFTIMMVADNPMVGAMAGMLGNASVMASMGRIERINGESFLNANDELSGLIGGRVLIQADGGSVDDMKAHLEQVDFDALADLGG
jgi:hypothetical protein